MTQHSSRWAPSNWLTWPLRAATCLAEKHNARLLATISYQHLQAALCQMAGRTWSQPVSRKNIILGSFCFHPRALLSSSLLFRGIPPSFLMLSSDVIFWGHLLTGDQLANHKEAWLANDLASPKLSCVSSHLIYIISTPFWSFPSYNC